MRLAEPDPPDHDVAEHFEVRRRIGQRQVHVGAQGREQDLRGFGDELYAVFERFGRNAQCRDLATGRDRPADFREQSLECGAVVHRHLASKQIERLYAVGAFMDRVEPVVAIEALYRILARVAVAAVHLDGQCIGFQAVLRGP